MRAVDGECAVGRLAAIALISGRVRLFGTHRIGDPYERALGVTAVRITRWASL